MMKIAAVGVTAAPGYYACAAAQLIEPPHAATAPAAMSAIRFATNTLMMTADHRSASYLNTGCI
jgi:hypothetical protein